MAATAQTEDSSPSAPSWLARMGRGAGCEGAESHGEGWTGGGGSLAFPGGRGEGWGGAEGSARRDVQLSKTQNSLATVHHHPSVMNWQQPEFPAQVPIWGTCLRSLGRTPVWASGHTKTHALWPRGPTLSDSPHRQSLTTQCLSSSCLLLPMGRCPISPARLNASQGQVVISCISSQCSGRPGARERLLQNPGPAKPCSQHLFTCSAHCPPGFSESFPGHNLGWTQGCREQTERQGGQREVTSSAPAVEPRG